LKVELICAVVYIVMYVKTKLCLFKVLTVFKVLEVLMDTGINNTRTSSEQVRQ
jgi:hypothetical protein